MGKSLNKIVFEIKISAMSLTLIEFVNRPVLAKMLPNVDGSIATASDEFMYHWHRT